LFGLLYMWLLVALSLLTLLALLRLLLRLAMTSTSTAGGGGWAPNSVAAAELAAALGEQPRAPAARRVRV
jgi:hypothetical protein